MTMMMRHYRKYYSAWIRTTTMMMTTITTTITMPLPLALARAVQRWVCIRGFSGVPSDPYAYQSAYTPFPLC